MKHKITYYVETKKKGILGFSRKVRKKKVAYVDGKTYRKLKRAWKNHPYTIEEMFMYDLLDGE